MGLRGMLNRVFSKTARAQTSYGVLGDAYREICKSRPTDVQFPEEMQPFIAYAKANRPQAHGQFLQDLFAAFALEQKERGTFCEFGATNGRNLSNSLFLERDLNWHGVLSEPGRGWHEELRQNRPETQISHKCVWKRSGEQLTFSESQKGEFSTLSQFASNDMHAKIRRKSTQYSVETISLSELLTQAALPSDLDFLSIDTEGSELDILTAHDFAAFCPKVITVEHNFTDARDGLYALLTGKGYKRVWSEISLCDDWYVHQDHSFHPSLKV